MLLFIITYGDLKVKRLKFIFDNDEIYVLGKINTKKEEYNNNNENQRN